MCGRWYSVYKLISALLILFFFFLWQSKEKLINSLKEGSGFEGLDSSTANSVELEELRHEKETQREEIQKLMGQIHQLRSELQVRVVNDAASQIAVNPRVLVVWEVSVFGGKGISNVWNCGDISYQIEVDLKQQASWPLIDLQL